MEEEKEVKQTSKPKKRKRKKIIAPIFLLAAVIAIGIGILFNYLGNPKRIMAEAVDKLSNGVDELFQGQEEQNSYTTNSDVNLSVESDYISYLASVDPTYQPFVDLFNNISKLDTNVTVTQDVEQEKLLAEISTNLNVENLLDFRYLIQENQAYYFIRNFLSTYIQMGDNDYFASLEKNGALEDQQYLYDFMMDSFKRNLKDSYFKKEKVTTELEGKNQETTKVTLILDDHNASELASNILQDLQADKRSSEILSAYDPEFSDQSIEVVENTDTEEALMLSVYTTSWNYTARKYELSYSYDGTESFQLSYEEQENRGVLQITMDDQVITATIEEKDNKTVITYYDQNDNQIGTMEITKDGENFDLSYQYDSDGAGILLELHSKTNNTTTNTTFQFLISAEDISILDIQADVTTEKTEAKEITEDVSNAVREDSITEEQQEQLQQIFTNFLLALFGGQDGINL